MYFYPYYLMIIQACVMITHNTVITTLGILGTEEERKVVSKVSALSSRRELIKKLRAYKSKEVEDINFTFNATSHENGDVTVYLSMVNEGKEVRTVTLNMHANALYYTGVTGEELSNLSKTIEIQPEQRKFLLLN